MRRHLPGLALVAGISAVSLAIAAVETRFFGYAMVEAIVLAILFGMIIRSAMQLPASLDPGIDLAAKQLLEVAIVLLGASVNLPLLVRAGPSLALGIVLLVALGLAVSYGIGRALGLPHQLAVLIAAGNSICGNSAIAAVAPVIGAEREHVASAIAFTAILGVAVVIGLPHLADPLGLSEYQYGALAGLTVYAVPQVVAATWPVGAVANQVGTMVKLVRVLMLGPVVLFFTLTHRNGTEGTRREFSLARALPWFIVGFLVMAGLRAAGLFSDDVVRHLKTTTSLLTLLAMAALGLGVDLRALSAVGPRVMLAVSASLLALIALSVTLIRALRLG